ncbi:hypothetical protein CU097_012453 [Rhizopus azygosporus]|uniref:AB hydrolase-1 domain-containing protein n=1 Tax=Rhizopus azygosporus TaxID=86630 RepID=A0A367JQT6_RHIAZ|nr:hypothetical protein CU097_012453 [Rhizopus azygosporus]
MKHPLDDSSVESFFIPGAKVYERFFNCPLDYQNPNTSSRIKIFVRHLVPPEKTIDSMKTMPFILYLQGGPGFECALPSNGSSGWIKVAFEKGYQVLLMDQRGTGLSCQISAESLSSQFKTDEEKAEYLSHFRADSIVRDCETIREQLTAGRSREEDRRIHLIGQSFGGFCITTYLSLFPKSVAKAYITGGVPPLVDTPDSVYRALYPYILSRNKTYYKKFPRDIERVRQIHRYLSTNTVTLPNGGTLSPRRFLQLGLFFGGSGGFDRIHTLVQSAHDDLERLGRISYRTLHYIQNTQDWDTNVLYAVLHEAIYCQNGQASGWAAERVLQEAPFNSLFEWRLDHLKEDQPIYFTGETIYPFMFDDYSELRPLKNVANLLAERPWQGRLYDVKVLNALEDVEVAASIYYDDMFVARELSEHTAAQINGIQSFITNEYAHNGLREDGERILSYMMKIASGEVAYNR